MDNVIKAIIAINPAAVYKITGSDLDTCTIEWLDGTSPISKADIQTKMDELQVEYDAQEYARKRKAEYPTIEELVVALYDTEDRAAIDEKRAAVKLKHPKGV
jgi:hypothetical protein